MTKKEKEARHEREQHEGRTSKISKRTAIGVVVLVAVVAVSGTLLGIWLWGETHKPAGSTNPGAFDTLVIKDQNGNLLPDDSFTVRVFGCPNAQDPDDLTNLIVIDTKAGDEVTLASIEALEDDYHIVAIGVSAAGVGVASGDVPAYQDGFGARFFSYREFAFSLDIESTWSITMYPAPLGMGILTKYADNATALDAVAGTDNVIGASKANLTMITYTTNHTAPDQMYKAYYSFSNASWICPQITITFSGATITVAEFYADNVDVKTVAKTTTALQLAFDELDIDGKIIEGKWGTSTKKILTSAAIAASYAAVPVLDDPEMTW